MLEELPETAAMPSAETPTAFAPRLSRLASLDRAEFDATLPTLADSQASSQVEATAFKPGAEDSSEIEESRRLKRLRALRVREWIGMGVALAVILAFGANFKPVRVVGTSMEPTLHNGSTVLVWKTARRFSPLRAGDIVVFRGPDGEELIKRVIFVQKPDGSARMPFQIWTPRGLIAEPLLMVNRHRLFFPDYIRQIYDGKHHRKITRTIYVMGDNTWGSEDSRVFGPVAPSAVLGKVILPRPDPRIAMLLDPKNWKLRAQQTRSSGAARLHAGRSRLSGDLPASNRAKSHL